MVSDLSRKTSDHYALFIASWVIITYFAIAVPPLGGWFRPTMGIPDEVQGRVGEPKELEGLSDDDLKAVLKEYYDRYSHFLKYKM